LIQTSALHGVGVRRRVSTKGKRGRACEKKGGRKQVHRRNDCRLRTRSKHQSGCGGQRKMKKMNGTSGEGQRQKIVEMVLVL